MLENNRSSILSILEENESGKRKPMTPPPSRGICFPLKSEEGLHDLDFVLTGFSGGPNSRKRGYKVIIFSYLAAFVDVLVGGIFSLLCVLASSSVLKVELWFQWTGGSVLQAEVFIYFASLYQFLLRLFLGFTLGDWVCGLRLGTAEERLLPNYAYRVGVRALIHWVSGFVLLPVISLLLGRDLAGQISGLHLTREDAGARTRNGK